MTTPRRRFMGMAGLLAAAAASRPLASAEAAPADAKSFATQVYTSDDRNVSSGGCMRVDIGALAAAEQMIPNAPLKASRSVVVEAPVEAVWQLLTGVSDWPRWHAFLKDARLKGPFAPGSALTYGGIIKHRLAIAKVERNRLVMISGTLAGYTAITRWDVEAINGGRTNITFTESSAGPLIALLYGNRRLGRHLEQWLAALKAEAER